MTVILEDYTIVGMGDMVPRDNFVLAWLEPDKSYALLAT